MDYCFSLADLAEFFRGCSKTGKGRLLAFNQNCFARGHGVPNHNQAERIPARSMLDMASGRQHE